jgi:hypothetical protein
MPIFAKCLCLAAEPSSVKNLKFYEAFTNNAHIFLKKAFAEKIHICYFK